MTLVVPISQHDLSEKDTYAQVLTSFESLQQASDLLLSTIASCVQSRNERLSGLMVRFTRAQERLDALAALPDSEGLVIRHPAAKPAAEAQCDWDPPFSGLILETSHPQEDAAFETVLPTAGGQPGRLRGQETAELLHFFREAQAHLTTVSTQIGPRTSVPHDLQSALNLPRPQAASQHASQQDEAARAAWMRSLQEADGSAQHSLLHGAPRPGLARPA